MEPLGCGYTIKMKIIRGGSGLSNTDSVDVLEIPANARSRKKT
jgi:hypothetical protein